jgi:hypothetical protein
MIASRISNNNPVIDRETPLPDHYHHNISPERIPEEMGGNLSNESATQADSKIFSNDLMQ